MENVVRLIPPVQTNDDKVLFTDFWAIYPKRVARKLAERAWDKIDESEYGDILLALVAWRRVWRQRGDDQYTPNPASWLNGERWTDELPAEFTRQQSSHASHEPAKLPEAGERRSAMPDAVRALLTKIRKQ